MDRQTLVEAIETGNDKMVRSLRSLGRTVSTFCLGFSLGIVLHVFVAFTVEMSSVRRGAQMNEPWEDEYNGSSSAENQISGSKKSPQDGPRVLCYILTGPTTHQTALHVKNTWGQRCDKTVFFSTQSHEELQPEILDIPEGYVYLWAKTKAALTHLHRHYPSYDWYLKADDDTFVIVENLRYFLLDKNPDEPVYYGVKFKKLVKQGFMSGGGGYVLSREAVKKFVVEGLQMANQALCPSMDSKGVEDVNLGMCMEAIGVKAGDSRDAFGKPRFFSHNPMSLFYKAPLINKFHWYWRYLWYKHDVGPDCCSPHIVTFHDVEPRMMWTLEGLLYRMQIHHELQPKALNTSTSPSIAQAPPASSSSNPG
ncbi:glycoprotein-N-acetylgalactosamine 3-beta-galactosyltransferase 1-like isoform X1 [Macrobrachium nipponense]|uniref:glycoprotein-N-acetylgalactosamine 3-beta-galactosyltransferase 1-like isoform X1 n=2 Tax=Macrobrachium nipponense TaxID=159736 RepID=UPI0030C877CE